MIIIDEPDDIPILDIASKRMKLCANPPNCTNCGHEQVQLVDANKTEWRCRICKHRWYGGQ